MKLQLVYMTSRKYAATDFSIYEAIPGSGAFMWQATRRALFSSFDMLRLTRNGNTGSNEHQTSSELQLDYLASAQNSFLDRKPHFTVEVNANKVRLLGISLRHEVPINTPWISVRFDYFLNHVAKNHFLMAELEVWEYLRQRVYLCILPVAIAQEVQVKDCLCEGAVRTNLCIRISLLVCLRTSKSKLCDRRPRYLGSISNHTKLVTRSSNL